MAGASWGVKVDKKDERLTVARLQQVPGKTHEWTMGIVKRAALAGGREMERLAPESSAGEGSGFEANSTAVARKNPKEKLKRRIQATNAYNEMKDPVRRPGAAGGGFSYQTIIGPRPLAQYRDFPTHDPSYILRHGSGEKGGPGSSGRRIHAGAGNVLTFMSDGRQWFPQWTRGQRANDAWFQAGYHRARSVLRSNANTLKL